MTAQEHPLFVCPAAKNNYVLLAGNTGGISRSMACTTAMLGLNAADTGFTSDNPRRSAHFLTAPSETLMVIEDKLGTAVQVAPPTAASLSNLRWSPSGNQTVGCGTDLAQPTSQQSVNLNFHHNETMNVLYLDYSARTLRFSDRARVTQPLWEGR